MMLRTVGVVGSGPMGIYTLSGLINSQEPLHIILFEKGNTAGIGAPYSPDSANRMMLANIASIEIPAIGESYLDWLRALPEGELAKYRINPDSLDKRSFTPRLLLGGYFRDQLLGLVKHGTENGHLIELREQVEISDITLIATRVALHHAAGRIEPLFDQVVLATGHHFPEADPRGSYFPSPWSGLIRAQIKPGQIGILGTSLSAIDAVMAIACQHGRFIDRAGQPLAFEPATDKLNITMMSRTGLLPEADFYCPLPYAPLDVMTDAALKACLKSPEPLDAAFELFRDEIVGVDPGYASAIGLAAMTVDDFADAYFAQRLAADPFSWAARNLNEVQANKANRVTIPWRYAILRMHEKIETLVAALGEEDRARFDAGLKRVFIDNYAAVPPESIRRLLALHAAGVLDVASLSDDYALEVGADETTVHAGETKLKFSVFVDARGQKALHTEDLPFPSLRAALLAAGQDILQIDEGFGLTGVAGYSGHVLLGAIPYLMQHRPFVQGITACAEIGSAIAQTILLATSADTRICA